MRDEGNYYLYMVCYCDDMIVVHKYPDHVFDSILGKGFTIKEISYPEYFLGRYFECVKEPNSNNEILTSGSKTYVKRTMKNFKNNFAYDPYKKHYSMPPD